ncbi:hypothetical protein QZH41_006579 [Actinostola sp. cb2023]|nr:hypothetical protein QZH41_006579 [Actinostola sp. cb2023]
MLGVSRRRLAQSLVGILVRVKNALPLLVSSRRSAKTDSKKQLLATLLACRLLRHCSLLCSAINLTMAISDKYRTKSYTCGRYYAYGFGNWHSCVVFFSQFRYARGCMPQVRLHRVKRQRALNSPKSSAIRGMQGVALPPLRSAASVTPVAPVLLCDKNFRTSNELNLHTPVHNKDTPYKCEFCSKEFRTKGCFKSHIKYHIGDKRHKCTECDRAFVKSADLKRHLAGHNNEKNYKCKECDSSFTRRDNLKAHMLLHSRESVVTCDMCNKEFINTVYLKRHMHIHKQAKKKPYE